MIRRLPVVALTSAALRAITEKLDDQGAGALLGGSKLPDYKP